MRVTFSWDVRSNRTERTARTGRLGVLRTIKSEQQLNCSFCCCCCCCLSQAGSMTTSNARASERTMSGLRARRGIAQLLPCPTTPGAPLESPTTTPSSWTRRRSSWCSIPVSPSSATGDRKAKEPEPPVQLDLLCPAALLITTLYLPYYPTCTLQPTTTAWAE
jgi:hypothetical protein